VSRIPPAPAEKYEPVFGAGATLSRRIHAQAPAIAGPFGEFMKTLRESSVLPRRLVELVRLRVSFHNQCRSCMAIRYADGVVDGVTEDLVCSLEKPEDAPDLSEREKVALAFADKMATDHLSISDDCFADLGRHFTTEEQMDLCFQVASFVGYGRMNAVLAMTDDLPEEYADPDAVLAPWKQAPQKVV
jgi:AhpD family alkylhydroperoxidase